MLLTGILSVGVVMGELPVKQALQAMLSAFGAL
jgi:hypothetical protein